MLKVFLPSAFPALLHPLDHNLQGWQGSADKLKGLPEHWPPSCVQNKLNCKSETAGLRCIKNDNNIYIKKKAQCNFCLVAEAIDLIIYTIHVSVHAFGLK